MQELKTGDTVRSPRFGSVRIARIYKEEDKAFADGYTESAHVWGIDGWRIFGKYTESNRLPEFAAVRIGVS